MPVLGLVIAHVLPHLTKQNRVAPLPTLLSGEDLLPGFELQL
ncbi:hypothetical protein [Trichormus azollae]|jgi:hypothetical protein